MAVDKNPLEEMEQFSQSTTESKMQYLGNLKNNRMISVSFQGKSFNITTIQVYDPTSDAKEAELDQFYDDDTTSRGKKKKKKVLLIIVN